MGFIILVGFEMLKFRNTNNIQKSVPMSANESGTDQDYASDEDEELRKELLQDLMSEDEEDDQEVVSEVDVNLKAEDSVEEYDDDLYKGEEDRRKLEAMTQLQREQILYDREQRRNKWLSRLEATNLKKGRDVREVPKNKASGALQDIRDRRSQKGRAKQSLASYMDDDEYGEFYQVSDDDSVEVSRRKVRKTEKVQKKRKAVTENVFMQTKTPLDLKTVKDLQIRRSTLEAFFMEPFFEEYIQGMFVRVSARKSNTTGKPVYYMARIEGIRTSSTYSFGKGRSNVKLRLSIGKDVQDFRMIAISNQGIDQILMDEWIEAMEKHKMKAPTCEEALKTKIDREELRKNYRYSHEDVQRMIARTKEINSSKVNVTREITNLEFAMNEALQKGNTVEAEKLQEKIDLLKAQQEAMLNKKYGTGKPVNAAKKRKAFMSVSRNQVPSSASFNLSKRKRLEDEKAASISEKNVHSPEMEESTVDVQQQSFSQILDNFHRKFPFIRTNSREFNALVRSHAAPVKMKRTLDVVPSSLILNLHLDSFCQYVPFTDNAVFDKTLTMDQYMSALAD